MNHTLNTSGSYSTLQEGQVRTGIVGKITDYGAIVTLEGGVKGVVHISEITWKDIKHPSEIVRVGDEVRVTILKIDTKQQTLWLSIKATEPHPWDTAAEHYSIGGEVTATVLNVVNYGAFVELEKGIEGLLHVSDISSTRKFSHPSELFEKGQKIKCRILSVDQQRRRVSLGLTEL